MRLPSSALRGYLEARLWRIQRNPDRTGNTGAARPRRHAGSSFPSFQGGRNIECCYEHVPRVAHENIPVLALVVVLGSQLDAKSQNMWIDLGNNIESILQHWR